MFLLLFLTLISSNSNGSYFLNTEISFILKKNFVMALVEIHCLIIILLKFYTDFQTFLIEK